MSLQKQVDRMKPFNEFTKEELKSIIIEGIEIHTKCDYGFYVSAQKELGYYMEPPDISDSERGYFNAIFKEVMLERGANEEDIKYRWNY